MAVTESIILKKASQEKFITYYKAIQNQTNEVRGQIRSRFENVDKEYQRELDYTEQRRRAEAANKAGRADFYQDITVPVVMPQVEAAVTHQSSVFLTGEPIFGVVSSPQYIDESLQLQSLIQEQSIKGGWVRQFMLSFRDGFKYNFAPIEVDWSREVTHTVDTDATISTSEGIPKKVLWEGNRVRRLDPYNTFVDTKVPASEVYKDGEYAHTTELMTRIKLKKFISELPAKIIANVKTAFESSSKVTASGAVSTDSMHYYIPSVNPHISEQDYKGEGTNWLQWAGLNDTKPKIDYKDMYEVTTLYARILPSEFDLAVPEANTPQVYKLIIVNHEVIIYAERQTNAHGYIPVFIGQPLEDGLGYQTKAFSENSIPFQQLSTAYMKSIIASRRRSVSDRVLYDASRVSPAEINSDNPSAKIPVKPSAYGKNIAEAVYAFPYREDQQSANMQQIQTILELSDSLSGQNRAQRGQFTKGNRTLQEFDSIMQNAAGRDQLASLLLEHQIFMPMKQVIKINILQFQGGTSVFNRETQQDVTIDPIALRKAVLNFRVSDGLVPTSKIINAETLAVALQTMGSSPAIASGYNVTPVFSYLMKTQGADLRAFEKSPEQVAYEQAMAQWQNLVAMAIEKSATGELPENFPPQPLPEQFNYDPAAPAANQPQTPTPGAPS